MRKSYIPTVAELDAFCACARLGTTTLAAKSLNLTQSAISRSVASLEERLGVNLFTRARQRLALSDAGRAFLPEAETLLVKLNEAAVSVMAFGGHGAIMRIAALPTFGRIWLVPRLARYQAHHPDVTFDVTARLSPVDFEDDPFDVAVMRGPHQAGGGDAIPLVAETLVVVAAPSLLDDAAALSDEELLSLPLLQQSTRPTLWLDWFRHAALDPRRILRGARFDHFDMVLDAAKAGLGVALVPELLAREPLRDGSLRLASPRRFSSGETYMLFYPERSAENPVFTQFRDWLVGAVNDAAVPE